MEHLVRIGAVASALGVSVDTLRRWERQGRITFVRRGGDRYLPGAELARLLRERAPRTGTSARNRLDGVVVDVKADGVMAQVDLACGPFRIVSLMSREAVEELGLRPGSPARAVVKATTVIVEAGGRPTAAGPSDTVRAVRTQEEL
jgi:molybdopterin-binding protein